MTHAILTFDTLAYANKLKQAGVPEKQAEIQAETMAEILHNDLATKQDLKELRIEFKYDLEQFKFELLLKLTGAMVVTMGLFTGILGIFIKLMLH